jgi:hypothetical protein
MKRFFVFVIVVALSLVASGLLLAQSNPSVGTWKLNLAKSKFSPAGTAPKSDTLTIEAQGDGVKVSTDGVAGDGNRIAASYTTNYDGKDSAVSGLGFPNGADTIAVKRVDANTSTATAKKAGKVVYTRRLVVSKDGKVMTITAKGTNEQGQPTSSTTVWDKQ